VSLSEEHKAEVRIWFDNFWEGQLSRLPAPLVDVEADIAAFVALTVDRFGAGARVEIDELLQGPSRQRLWLLTEENL
jgi:hypothetical protein